jgi:uncharacterized protein YgfB (UPF0149 family)
MTHPELEAALERIGVTFDAAEAHGWLAGALCVRKDYGEAEWLADLAADSGGESPDAGAALADVVAGTRASLESGEFGFAPLLPDDDAPLGERVAALAAWSEGFLVGFGTGASEEAVRKAGDVGEFLRDLAEIARAELEPEQAGEAGEGDYAQLVEFVLAGAQLAYDELAGARADAAG